MKLIFISIILTLFISCNEIELSSVSDVDINREVPYDAPKVNNINEDILDSIIQNSNKHFFLINLWSFSRPCINRFNVDLMNKLFDTIPKVEFILISYDLNIKNMKKAIQLELYDYRLMHETYILDYSLNLFDLTNEENLIDFMDEIIENDYKSINEYPIAFILDKNKRLLKKYGKANYKSIINDIERL